MSINAAKLRSTKLIIRRTRVELPEFGKNEDGENEWCWVYGMTALEKTRHDAEAMNKSWSGVVSSVMMTTKERLILKSMRDEDGSHILGNGDQEQIDADVKLLQGWPADIVNRIFDAANDLCGGGSDEKK